MGALVIATILMLSITIALGIGFELSRRRHARQVEQWARTFGLSRRPGESIADLRARAVRVMRGVARVNEQRPPLRSIRGGRR